MFNTVFINLEQNAHSGSFLQCICHSCKTKRILKMKCFGLTHKFVYCANLWDQKS